MAEGGWKALESTQDISEGYKERLIYTGMKAEKTNNSNNNKNTCRMCPLHTDLKNTLTQLDLTGIKRILHQIEKTRSFHAHVEDL